MSLDTPVSSDSIPVRSFASLSLLPSTLGTSTPSQGQITSLLSSVDADSPTLIPVEPAASTTPAAPLPLSPAPLSFHLPHPASIGGSTIIITMPAKQSASSPPVGATRSHAADSALNPGGSSTMSTELEKYPVATSNAPPGSRGLLSMDHVKAAAIGVFIVVGL